VLGENLPEVREIIEKRAKELASPFYYAPDMALELEIPEAYSLAGSFNRENALTVIAALKVIRERKLFDLPHAERLNDGFSNVVWPGRFQKVGNVLVDGAHNPPAARALVNALQELPEKKYILVAGFCADKDVGETLSILAPFVSKAYAVRTNNPRSIEPSELALKMRSQGIDADVASTLSEALRLAKADVRSAGDASVLVCGSLFLAGEALVALNAYPWPSSRFDPSERL
jgi:dihydrofolate synthase/folylpolyglutamate synthase